MSERVQDYVVDYSVTKLEETARTFRRLGEAYENASEPQKSGTGILEIEQLQLQGCRASPCSRRKTT